MLVVNLQRLSLVEFQQKWMLVLHMTHTALLGSQDAYSILVLPDDGTSNLQCESQLLFLGHSKVPNSTDGQVCLDAELNGQNYVNLEIENANAYPPCLVDTDIEKGNSETPKTNDEDVEKLKIEGPLTHLQKALQRQISLQIGEKVVQLLMNDSLVSPKFPSRVDFTINKKRGLWVNTGGRIYFYSLFCTT